MKACTDHLAWCSELEQTGLPQESTPRRQGLDWVARAPMALGKVSSQPMVDLEAGKGMQGPLRFRWKQQS